MPKIIACERLEDCCEFQARLGYGVRPGLKEKMIFQQLTVTRCA